MLKLAEIFTDHMVFAHGKKCVIWGESSEYSVTVKLDDETVYETVFGEFEAYLPETLPGGPHTVSVIAGDEEITLSDVYFGEVWLAGGQSNMEFLLKSDADYEKAVKGANIPILREFQVPRAEYKDYRRDHPEKFATAPKWFTCTPETCGDFSAVAFWYAKKFTEKYKIPVGIIYCNCGGSSASAWIDKYTLATVPEAHEYVLDYERDLKGVSFHEYIKRHDDYYEYDRIWHEKAEELIRTEGLDVKAAYSDPRIGACPSWPPPSGPWHFSSPSNLYYGMLSTIIPFTLTKVLWYQGEEDVPKSTRYEKLLKAMINEWRRDFRDGSLPFILIMITPYSYDWNDPMKTDSCLIREADVKLSKKLENVSYVVTTDMGERYEIHPPHKKKIGDRIFETERYKYEKVPLIKSPEVVKASIVTRKVSDTENQNVCLLVYFDTDLKVKAQIKGFQVVYGDGKVCKAKAEFFDAAITNEPEFLNRVIKVNLPDTTQKPTEIRYAYADYIESDLYVANTLPAVPFRVMV